MTLLAFGDYVLDTAEKRLLRDDRPIDIAGMPLALLCYFIEHAADGRVVTKDELRQQIWSCKVEDVTIRSSLSGLREALGDTASQPRYLQTHGKEGWRLLLPVYKHSARAHGIRIPPGGAYDPAGYVPRLGEEKLLLDSLQNSGWPVVVYGPPGSGKRMLIERSLERATANERAPLGRILRVNVRSAVEPPPASLDAMLREIGRLILEASGRPEEASRRTLDSFWSPPILAKQKLRELVTDLLSTQAAGSSELPTALVLCDVDRLASCPYQDDVFNMLRAWQDDHFLRSLRLVVETILPPRLFPLGGQSPLWTKAQRVDVSRISLKQLLHLAELHGVQPSRQACERLGALVDWNVYLCCVALYYGTVQGLALEAVLDRYQPAQRAFSAFADHLENLSHELDRLDATGAFPKPIGPLLKQAASGVSLPLETAWRLLRKGVIAETETRGLFCLRCPLYADYFRTRPS